MKTMVWGNKVIVVEGTSVKGILQDDEIIPVASELYVMSPDDPSIYGMYNGIRIPISIAADIRVPDIVMNYAGIELTLALSNIGQSLAIATLLSKDFAIDFDNCITSVIFNDTPYSHHWASCVGNRKIRYGNTPAANDEI